MNFFPKFKNDDIISAISSFYCFFICTSWGGGGGGVYKKSTFCMLVKMMKTWVTPKTENSKNCN